MKVEQDDNYAIRYTVTTPGGQQKVLPPDEVLHLKSLSLDGVVGLSRVRQAADIIETALNAQRAANRLFKNGVIAGVALEHPSKLSPEAFDRLKASLESYVGAENAGRSMVLEEGMKRSFPPTDAKSAQLHEVSAAQVEAIARIFGVPRPLMMVDDTSWGSGIEQLAILFVRFALAPLMKAWEEAIARTLIPDSQWGVLEPDYDERELLRGTLKDQAEFFAKALGSGGHRPWMEANEVRELSGLGSHRDGNGLVAAGENHVTS
jgi:HK97 family phage portal protein